MRVYEYMNTRLLAFLLIMATAPLACRGQTSDGAPA